ncbi:MAG: hypothetical protein ACYS5V_13285, partial [Planctomycetota bacterium]
AILEGKDGWRGQLPNDRIRFFTVSVEPVRQGRPESDVKECEFRLSRTGREARRRGWDHRGEPGASPVLLRRLDPTRNQAPDEGGVVELIARDVVALDVTYHDGVAWRDEWSSKKEKRWPMAVRIRLAVLARAKPPKVWTTSRVVTFPYRPAQKPKSKE